MIDRPSTPDAPPFDEAGILRMANVMSIAETGDPLDHVFMTPEEVEYYVGTARKMLAAYVAAP